MDKHKDCIYKVEKTASR